MIKKIAPDKWKHFLVGIAMGIVLQIFLWYILPSHPALTAVTSFVLVIVISYGFEVFSLITGKGHYDFMDAVAGTIGGLIGLLIVLLFQLHLVI